MEWALEEREKTLIVRPSGRVDGRSWEAFGRQLAEAVERANATQGKLIVDFSGLDHLSPRGLRALTVAHRAAGAAGVEIVLAGANDIMREILAISRYDRIFCVADTVETAL